MKTSERRLLQLLRALPESEREALLAFAEFLAGRSAAVAQPPGAPLPEYLARPETETVVGAIKRLSAGYPMLDRRRLLDETSVLMAQHVLHGRAAAEVIDDLEALFARRYRELATAGNEERDASGQAIPE